jgi:peptide/nickel transport system permease protein
LEDHRAVEARPLDGLVIDDDRSRGGLALLISGVVVTESVFAIPGLGRLTVDAILRRDYPIIQGVILVFSAAYVVVNLLIDVCYTFLDPRIRY